MCPSTSHWPPCLPKCHPFLAPSRTPSSHSSLFILPYFRPHPSRLPLAYKRTTSTSLIKLITAQQPILLPCNSISVLLPVLQLEIFPSTPFIYLGSGTQSLIHQDGKTSCTLTIASRQPLTNVWDRWVNFLISLSLTVAACTPDPCPPPKLYSLSPSLTQLAFLLVNYLHLPLSATAPLSFAHIAASCTFLLMSQRVVAFPTV